MLVLVIGVAAVTEGEDADMTAAERADSGELNPREAAAAAAAAAAIGLPVADEEDLFVSN